MDDLSDQAIYERLSERFPKDLSDHKQKIYTQEDMDMALYGQHMKTKQMCIDALRLKIHDPIIEVSIVSSVKFK